MRNLKKCIGNLRKYRKFKKVYAELEKAYRKFKKVYAKGKKAYRKFKKV
jgi:hypothetical protein